MHFSYGYTRRSKTIPRNKHSQNVPDRLKLTCSQTEEERRPRAQNISPHTECATCTFGSVKKDEIKANH